MFAVNGFIGDGALGGPDLDTVCSILFFKLCFSPSCNLLHFLFLAFVQYFVLYFVLLSLWLRCVYLLFDFPAAVVRCSAVFRFAYFLIRLSGVVLPLISRRPRWSSSEKIRN